MRVANLNGRLALATDLATDAVWIDVERASDGRFDSDPQAVYERWAEFARWARSASDAERVDVSPELLDAPAPRPRQVFAIGLNYKNHAAESGFALPQDLSERIRQHAGPAPQFSLGKSFPGFGPTGPWLVTPDELTDPDDLLLTATVNGEQVQQGRTTEMIFPVPELIAQLSEVATLLPGDVIFTGTPAGVGAGRQPPRFLAPGDDLVSVIDGIGQMRHTFVVAE